MLSIATYIKDYDRPPLLYGNIAVSSYTNGARSNPRLHHRSITYIALYRRLLRKHCFRSSNGETIFPKEQNFHAGNSSTPLTKFMFINDAYWNVRPDSSRRSAEYNQPGNRIEKFPLVKLFRLYDQ